MSEKTSFDVDIKVENLPQFLKALDRFGPSLPQYMFPTLQRTAGKMERILKGEAPYKTGNLMRSTYCEATFKPLGFILGALAKYAYWTEAGHGTWLGGWFSRAFNKHVYIIVEGFDRALRKAVEKYQREVES